MRLRTARKRGTIPRNITHEHYIRCDNTGLRILSGDSRKQWDNQIVWKGQFDERNPQEFVRGVVDNFAVMDARPESPDSVVLATGAVIDAQLTGGAVTLLQLDAGSLKYVSFVRFTITKFGLILPVFLQVGNDTLVDGNGDVLTAGNEFIDKTTIFHQFATGLRIETSNDAVTWADIDDPLTRLLLDRARIGEAIELGIGRNARYVRIVSTITPPETIEYSVSATIRGGQAI
jgi:hypothetical protein